MMNIFDVGGITTAIAVIATIIIGTGIFALINKIFSIITTPWFNASLSGRKFKTFFSVNINKIFTYRCQRNSF